MKRTSAGHTRKHTGTRKHVATLKHHSGHARGGAKAHGAKVHAVASHVKHAKARALSPGGLVACCAVDAVAASLRLAGWPVGAAGVLDLWARVADGPDSGVTIAVALAGAARWGLAGVRPSGFAPVTDLDADLVAGIMPVWRGADGRDSDPDTLPLSSAPGRPRLQQPSLLLGVDLPGPHAVCPAAGLWSSWGGWHDPARWPDAVIEEAWQVIWP